ncbi:MAG TPA: hypothetical protein VNK25_00290 [Candidatus Nitrosotenuis sp.]|jgi:predicted RNA-binding Zn-ribbon protein involved in translation (DUF1610 family)|nr:hypothetical protein [Nitrososphaerota archaeon]HXG13556.1 hypothetical protein [Candidatus Nitrosotenuis sp.]
MVAEPRTLWYCPNCGTIKLSKPRFIEYREKMNWGTCSDCGADMKKIAEGIILDDSLRF